MEYKEHKIGEIITLTDGRRLTVVEGSECSDCYFRNRIVSSDSGVPECKRLLRQEILGWCIDVVRTDHKNIIYKEIKEK